MRFEADVKLDFKDVLIRPKRSVLTSRAEVRLERTYEFRNSRNSWSGVPIVAANMDSTGTLATARSLAARRLLTCVVICLPRCTNILHPPKWPPSPLSVHSTSIMWPFLSVPLPKTVRTSMRWVNFYRNSENHE